MGVPEYFQSPLALETSQEGIAGVHEAVQVQGPGQHRQSGRQKGAGHKRRKLAVQGSGVRREKRECRMQHQVDSRQYRSKEQPDQWKPGAGRNKILGGVPRRQGENCQKTNGGAQALHWD